MTSTPPKERGIMFHARSINAILAGRKTMTRRIINPQPTPSPERGEGVWMQRCGRDKWDMNIRLTETFKRKPGKPPEILPSEESVMPVEEWLLERVPWKVGTRLYVKEKFSVRGLMHAESMANVAKYANRETCIVYAADDEPARKCWKWRSPLYMPRWASRITLEIERVRVQRIQEISELDALSEGVEGERIIHGTMKTSDGKSVTGDWIDGPARNGFAALWDDTNGAGAWERNDFVSAISFKVVK